MIDIDPDRPFFNIFHAKVDTEAQFKPAIIVVSSFSTTTLLPALIDSNKQFAECGSTLIHIGGFSHCVAT